MLMLALFSLGSVALAQSPEQSAQEPLTIADQLREMIEPFVSSGGGAAPILQMEGLQVQLYKDLIPFIASVVTDLPGFVTDVLPL